MVVIERCAACVCVAQIRARDQLAVTVPSAHPLLDYPKLPMTCQKAEEQKQEAETGQARTGIKARADAIFRRLVFSQFKTRAAAAVKNKLAILRDQERISQEAIDSFRSCVQV